MGELRSPRFAYDRIPPHDASVRAFGDAAVLVGRGTFTVNGGVVFQLVYTEVYAKRRQPVEAREPHACSDSF